jgi:hypothetical protein
MEGVRLLKYSRTRVLALFGSSELSCSFQGGCESIRGLLGSKQCTAIVSLSRVLTRDCKAVRL